MQVVKGISALSEFRTRQLLAKLKIIEPAIEGVSAEYIHFIDANKKLSATELKKVEKLLEYGEHFAGETSKQTAIIVPRVGTISSWSSKATDIAKNSGLEKVNRIERGTAYYFKTKGPIDLKLLTPLLHDRMTESVLYSSDKAAILFTNSKATTFSEVPLLSQGSDVLHAANAEMGLALSDDEIEYLARSYSDLGRNPTDAELMMFSVVNSEHCRHKIFNAEWKIDGEKQTKSLFKKIKNTYESGHKDVLSAYSDNAAVLRGAPTEMFYPDPQSKSYEPVKEDANIVIKVETHNHPTAVSPVPGAATGVGGEIRDEGATGRGAKPKMGLTGFSVSNLNIPGYKQPWEKQYGKPDRIVSALDIMLDAPIGGAAFSNEFGRPNLAGYFRTYEQSDETNVWGYHKPIMIAGGAGNIATSQIKKGTLKAGDRLVILGGPAMSIGLGGGTASSMHTGQSDENLDFASVQRANAEIERRAQEVINTCWTLGEKNPIITIHDVGAGGISNALPELVHDSSLGATFDLRSIPNAQPDMTPMEIWCNEAQERYVLGVASEDVEKFEKICKRERCPFAVVGYVTEREHLVLTDRDFKNNPVDIPMSLLFGNAPKMLREFSRNETNRSALNLKQVKLKEAAERVLRMPAVGNKKFLITIGDRSVGGLTVRDQMVGPWQVPVADVAVTASSFGSKTGEAMAMGEKTPLALINSAASARMAVGETILNMAAAPIEKLPDIKLSANWMAAAGYGDEDKQLFDAVSALGDDFCPELGITIPVGKDSLSMRTTWNDDTQEKSVTSPLSLIISGFAPVANTKRVLTPQLSIAEDTELLLIDLGYGMNRLGGSILAQAYGQIGDESPDIDAASLKKYFSAVQELNADGLLLAYHDRSDGGLFATLCEMAFASRIGLSIDIGTVSGSPLDVLFNEELGAVIQVKSKDSEKVIAKIRKSLGNNVYVIGKPAGNQNIEFKSNGKRVFQEKRATLESIWSETSYRIQRLRDNPECANEEFKSIADDKDPGLSPNLTFKIGITEHDTRPKAAILREQGTNGHVELAAAFHHAGFHAVDVHLNDIASGDVTLADFSVLAVCGGFSYGDVLGAGEGWAKSILYNDNLRDEFKSFFERKDTLSLGVCNGCQMLSALKEIIPGTDHWPEFKKNTSEQFEARLVGVKVSESPSVFFKGMEGSVIPIQVAHGEGRASFNTDELETTRAENLAPLHYVDNYGSVAVTYPANPNGSPDGITSLTSKDGRATILMPHPERGFLTLQYSWHPDNWGEYGPWFKIFQNARQWFSD